MHFNTIFSSIFVVAATTGFSASAQPLDMPPSPLSLLTPGPLPAARVPVHVSIDAAELASVAQALDDALGVGVALPERDLAPRQVTRRVSRKAKALHARHWHHHHHHHQSEQVPQAGVTTVYTTITTSVPAATPTDSETPQPTESETPTNTEGAPTSTEEPAPSSSSSSGVNPPAPSTGAVIDAPGSQCGDPNATPDPSPTGGPNGDENWLNCGVDGGGWVPPPVTLSNLIYRDLSEVLQENGNPFAACSPYLSMFQDMEAETGVPTIFLASIALQESGCNPTVTGGAGEIGMMQITSEKCPSDGSDCFDAATNIGIGARYFRSVIDQNNGNVAAAMGNYNGWYDGLTVALANNYAICAQHNNLDYLQNVFNGFLQGVDPGSLNMGIYHNTC